MTKEKGSQPRPHWTQSEGAKDRLSAVLRGTGTLLELEVAAICQEFSQFRTLVNDSEHPLYTGISTYRATYRSEGEKDVIREIDQVVSINTSTGTIHGLHINHRATIVIECKHRDSVEVFCFPYQTAREAKLEIIHKGRLACAEHPNNGVLGVNYTIKHPSFFEGTPRGIIQFVEFKANGPDIFKENLSYNVINGLFDYIHTLHPFEATLSRELLEEFAKSVNRSRMQYLRQN